MKLKQIMVTVSALAIVCLGVVLSGCGEQSGTGTGTGTANASGSTGTSAQDAAKSQFLAERGGGGTPGAGATGSGTAVPGGGNGGFRGRAPGVFGSVVKVDGNKITVKSQADGTESVVQLVDGAKIHKQSEAQKPDIKAGEVVLAFGTKNGDVVEAQAVQVGAGGGVGAFGFGGAGGFARGANGAGGNGAFPGGTAFPIGTPPADGQGGRQFIGGNGALGGREVVSGTVQTMDGDVVTVKLEDGTSATFKIGADTRLTKQVEVPLADLKEGDTVVATGEKKGDVFEATSLRVMDLQTQAVPAPPVP